MSTILLPILRSLRCKVQRRLFLADGWLQAPLGISPGNNNNQNDKWMRIDWRFYTG